MVEKHDLKRAEAEVEVGSAAALPANHLSGTRLAANVHRSVIAFAIRLWNLFGFLFFLFWIPSCHQWYSRRAVLMAKYNRLFLFPEMCCLLISSDAETMWRRTAREGGREGRVDEECPRMLSEGVAPKEGR